MQWLICHLYITVDARVVSDPNTLLRFFYSRVVVYWLILKNIIFIELVNTEISRHEFSNLWLSFSYTLFAGWHTLLYDSFWVHKTWNLSSPRAIQVVILSIVWSVTWLFIPISLAVLIIVLGLLFTMLRICFRYGDSWNVLVTLSDSSVGRMIDFHVVAYRYHTFRERKV
jgi:hypothetical protein